MCHLLYQSMRDMILWIPSWQLHAQLMPTSMTCTCSSSESDNIIDQIPLPDSYYLPSAPDTRQSHVCRVFSIGHSANTLPVTGSLPPSVVTTRHSAKVSHLLSAFAIYSANPQPLPSVLVRALGKASTFAECHGHCTRQTFVSDSARFFSIISLYRLSNLYVQLCAYYISMTLLMLHFCQ